MKGSLTWRASPEDTPLWTMPGQTWHTAPSLRDGQGPKYVCKRERQGRYICALKQCLVALESKTKGEVTAMCSTDSRSECVYLRVSGRVCMHVCWCVCVCVYAILRAPGLSFLCLCLSSNNPGTIASGLSGGG